MTHLRIVRLIHCSALFSFVLAAGCGKGAEEVKQGASGGTTAPPPQVQAPPPVVPKAVTPVPARPGDVAPGVASNAANNDPQPELPPADEGFEWVTVGSSEGDMFEVVPRPAEEAPKDLFAFASPPAGVDSSQFVTAGQESDPAGARPAVNTPPASRITLPAGLKPLPEYGNSPDGAPWRVLSEKDNAEMAYVPPGVVTMGIENGGPAVSPVLPVPLDGFYIDVTEVTLERYEAYRKDMRETKKLFKPEPANAGDAPNYAVRGIPWAEARLYGQWAGKTLPTEAQWEMAARGPSGFTHPWGNDAALWPRFRTMSELHPVKTFRTDKSVFGVYDLAGNVREWVADLYSETAYKDAQKVATSALKNWEGPKRGSIDNTRVVKGNGPGWAVWQRAPGKVSDKIPDVGFRCVVTVKPADATASN